MAKTRKKSPQNQGKEASLEQAARDTARDLSRKEDIQGLLMSEEVDALLNNRPLSGTGTAAETAEGIKAILDPSLMTYERLPLLDLVFDRLARQLSHRLGTFFGQQVEARLDKLTSARLGPHLDACEETRQGAQIFGLFHAETWAHRGLLTLDNALAYSLLDLQLGAGPGATALPSAARDFTAVEQRLIAPVLKLVLEELSRAFAPVTPAAFHMESIESNRKFAVIAPERAAAIVLSLWVIMGARGGRMELILPHAALEPVRELLRQGGPGETEIPDSIWEDRMAAELQATEVTLNAVIEGGELPLSEVLDWRVGSHLAFPAGPGAPVTLRCGDSKVLKGVLGPAADKATVALSERDPERE